MFSTLLPSGTRLRATITATITAGWEKVNDKGNQREEACVALILKIGPMAIKVFPT